MKYRATKGYPLYMLKKIEILCFILFIYSMFLGNSYIYFQGETPEVQTEAENASTYINAMSQTKLGKYSFININGGVLNLLHKHVVQDSNGRIFKMSNGYLCAESIYKETDETVAELENTYLALKEKNISTLFVSARGVVSKVGKELPKGVKEYDNLVTDTFLNQLKEKTIPYIDSYDVLSANVYNWEKNYFKTDHHWTPEAAFQVYQETCEYLNRECNFNIEKKYYSTEFLKRENYPQSFLGAEGRRTGKYYAGLDDFELIYPDYPTNFTLSIPNKKVTRNGNFYDAILDEQQILGEYSFERNSYYKYLGGDYPIVNIINHMQNNGKKIIVVKDSFGISFSSFLSLACEELSIVDVRYSEEPLENTIKHLQPDAVIFCYSPGYLGWTGIVSLNATN